LLSQTSTVTVLVGPAEGDLLPGDHDHSDSFGRFRGNSSSAGVVADESGG
jgi:hypothetical protein